MKSQLISCANRHKVPTRRNVMMFVLILLIVVLLLSTRNGTVNNSQTTKRNRAEEILEQRYAQGEISREKFLHIQKTLNSPL